MHYRNIIKYARGNVELFFKQKFPEKPKIWFVI